MKKLILGQRFFEFSVDKEDRLLSKINILLTLTAKSNLNWWIAASYWKAIFSGSYSSDSMNL